MAQNSMRYGWTRKEVDDRLQLNVALFWTDYSPFQICFNYASEFRCFSDGSATVRRNRIHQTDIGIGVASIYAALWFAAKVFSVGLLMYGKPPNFATLIKWVRAA